MALPGKDLELVEALVLRLLPPDILPNGGLVSAHGGDVVASRPKVLTREVLPPPEVGPGNVDGALPLDVPEDLRHRILRGNGEQHVDMVQLEMALLHHALALLGQFAQHRAEVLAQLGVQGLAAVLGNPDNMVLALPLGVG